jgi:O-acetylhomoserine/O-acetylserine sulfhydrylase-like pyridoxal-dependent enzyme
MKNRNGSLVRPDVLPESASRPVVTPLSPTVVYASDTPDVLDAQYGGQLPGYTYAREGHPNADVLAARIDRLENAPSKGIMTGSGMAAVGAVLMGLCKTGDHVIGSSLLYGRSLRMMTQDLPRMGIETTLVDPADPAALQAAIRPNTRLIMTEVVSNPTLRVADIKAMAQIARAAGANVRSGGSCLDAGRSPRIGDLMCPIHGPTVVAPSRKNGPSFPRVRT